MECRSENVTQGLSLTGLYFIMCLHQAGRAARNFGVGLDLLARALREAAAPHVGRVIRGASSLPLDLHHLISVTCPNDTNFSIPLGGAKIILASSTTNKHLTDVFVSAPGKKTAIPYCWLLLMACHGSLTFGARFPNWPAEMWNVLVSAA